MFLFTSPHDARSASTNEKHASQRRKHFVLSVRYSSTQPGSPSCLRASVVTDAMTNSSGMQEDSSLRLFLFSWSLVRGAQQRCVRFQNAAVNQHLGLTQRHRECIWISLERMHQTPPCIALKSLPSTSNVNRSLPSTLFDAKTDDGTREAPRIAWIRSRERFCRTKRHRRRSSRPARDL
jgi:hypothetical protein